jgi:hypothetical protein
MGSGWCSVASQTHMTEEEEEEEEEEEDNEERVFHEEGG